MKPVKLAPTLAAALTRSPADIVSGLDDLAAGRQPIPAEKVPGRPIHRAYVNGHRPTGRPSERSQSSA